jgi:phosphoglycolate phosphatase
MPDAMPPTLVFDLDGTLVDTAPDLLASLDHVLSHAGLPPADRANMRRYAGHGARVMIEQAHAAQRRTIETEEMARLLRVFLDHYSDGIPGISVPYPGVHATIGRFEAAGWRLAICTNKYEAFALKLIEGLDLRRHFHAICGADTFGFRKPDPRHLSETIRLAGGDPSRAVMVGDTRTDIDTAKAAGIPVVAVDFGYTDRHVREFEPSVVISHFDELSLDLAERLLTAGAP